MLAYITITRKNNQTTINYVIINSWKITTTNLKIGEIGVVLNNRERRMHIAIIFGSYCILYVRIQNVFVLISYSRNFANLFSIFFMTLTQNQPLFLAILWFETLIYFQTTVWRHSGKNFPNWFNNKRYFKKDRRL